MDTKEKKVFFLNALKISLAPTLHEGPFQVMFAWTQHTKEQIELSTRKRKAQKKKKAPRNAGLDPSTMKMKQWYQGQHRLSDKSLWQWPINRVSEKKAPTGTDRASCEARETIEDDEERLAMRQGDMPPLVPERVTNPRIREDRAGQDFQWNSEKMHRATYEDAYTRAWFHYCRSIFPQSVR